MTEPSFNVWYEPWITVERDGELPLVSIETALREAHNIRAVYDPSPLVVAATLRHLIAILQAIYRPKNPPALLKIWRAGQFDAGKIAKFGATYEERFDLYSADQPFFQSADLPLSERKKSQRKPVGYLLQERPAGSAVTHYTHSDDSEQWFCSRCAAKGLVTLPAFASSGGAGIKPSINGVPPIYVFPRGATLFETLTASLVTPPYQPDVSRDPDIAWWQHEPNVKEKKIVRQVGYVQSLTFPARQVRLHPQRMTTACSRCGLQTEWGVQTMVYKMGESRPKDAAFWNDPFAAYRRPRSTKEEKNPVPIRPVEGRALWREYGALFLAGSADEKGRKPIRPMVLNQLDELREFSADVLPTTSEGLLPLRTIGLRTDMKMKIFEWEESDFVVPPELLADEVAADYVESAIDFAAECDRKIKGLFRRYFGGGGQDERYKRVKNQMSRRYWQRLGERFMGHIGRDSTTPSSDWLNGWLDQTIDIGKKVFAEAAHTLPTNGLIQVEASLAKGEKKQQQMIPRRAWQEMGIAHCRRTLNKLRADRKEQQL